MKRLDKAASRQRWRELRDRWNAYDPIGVYDPPSALEDPETPLEEYEAYVGPTMRLLEQGASAGQIVDYLKDVSAHMGLDFDQNRALHHCAEWKRWFQDRWPNTVV